MALQTQIDIFRLARETIGREIDALKDARAHLGEEIGSAVDLIFTSKGKLVTTGIGKSGLIARKIAGTLSGTGCPAMFLHPVDALHGEIGVVLPQDVVIALSNSGRTEEVVSLCSVARSSGCRIIAITGDKASPLAAMSDVSLDASVAREACPLNLAPTSSAMVAMALGDVLAACLIHKTGFTPRAFSKLHPAGSLGRQLLLRVKDIMHVGDAIPIVAPDELIRGAIRTLSAKGMGAVIVVDSTGRLLGVFTDGDLRRTIIERPEFLSLSMGEVMTTTPVSISQDDLAIHAMELMENRPSQIAVLPVLDGGSQVVGILRIHDLLRVGFKTRSA